MKRLAAVTAGLLIGLAAASVLAAAVLLWYIRPSAPLDLSYEEVSFKAKAAEMVRNRRLAIEMTEADINNLIRKRLSEHPQVAPDLKVTGAVFHVDQDRLTGDLNLVYRGRIKAGVEVIYKLAWQDPYLIATFENVSAKSLAVPKEWVNPGSIELNIEELMPPLVGVKDIVFDGGSFQVWVRLGK